MKMPHQFIVEYPTPERSAALAAIIDKELKPKRNFNGPYPVFVIGLAALHFLFFTDPKGERRLAYIMPWAVLLITIIAIVFMIVQSHGRVNAMCQKLDECYDTYLNDASHAALHLKIKRYHECLRELKELRLERRYLTSCTKFYHRENQWLAHISKFWPTIIASSLCYTERGARLKIHRPYPFYNYWAANNQSLLALHSKHLTIDEIRRFLVLKRNLVATFYHEPTTNELIQEINRFTHIINKEEAAAREEMEEIYLLMEENYQKSYVIYMTFKDAYYKLAKDFDVDLPSFS